MNSFTPPSQSPGSGSQAFPAPPPDAVAARPVLPPDRLGLAIGFAVVGGLISLGLAGCGVLASTSLLMPGFAGLAMMLILSKVVNESDARPVR